MTDCPPRDHSDRRGVSVVFSRTGTGERDGSKYHHTDRAASGLDAGGDTAGRGVDDIDDMRCSPPHPSGGDTVTPAQDG